MFNKIFFRATIVNNGSKLGIILIGDIIGRLKWRWGTLSIGLAEGRII